MENEYLKIWFSNFPRLRYKLNQADTVVLSKISPFDYIDYNLTKESEVLAIIDVHKPQAWKWIRRYPALKKLTPEEYAVLDTMAPTDFTFDLSEEDVRRIIQYHLSNKKKVEESKRDKEAKAYYENHRKEIAAEERKRNKLTNIPVIGSLAGVATIIAGITHWNSHIGLGTCTVLGIGLILTSWLSIASKLKKLDSKSVIPQNKPDDSRLDFKAMVFIISYYILLIGLGVVLGSIPAWIGEGWDSACYIILTGVLIGGAAILFLILSAIVTHILE